MTLYKTSLFPCQKFYVLQPLSVGINKSCGSKNEIRIVSRDIFPLWLAQTMEEKNDI